MKITIRIKSLYWQGENLDGKEMWEAAIFGGTLKFTITSDPHREYEYRAFIGQDFIVETKDLNAAKDVLQSEYEDYMDQLIMVNRS